MNNLLDISSRLVSIANSLTDDVFIRSPKVSFIPTVEIEKSQNRYPTYTTYASLNQYTILVREKLHNEAF